MTRKRQLQLPGTLRRPAPPAARAKKDLSDAAFERALERHGFRWWGPIRFRDLHAKTPAMIDGICRTDPLRLARRATLAKLIRSRETQ